MHTWIVLLRGINVGGKNIVPMKELRALLGELGFAKGRSYIQSGNCAFESELDDPAAISEKISAGMQAKFGFTPKVMTLSKQDLQAAITANPFAEGEDNPKCLHFYFLSQPAVSADSEALATLAAETEQYTLTDEVLYLYAPDGIGRSKFAARAESKLGVATTARNYRTVLKLADMAG